MRTLNLRLTAWLLVIAVVLAGGIHLLHGFQVRRNAHVFLREAQRARDEGNKGDAARQYQRYLQFMPDDVEALADYALLLADVAAERPSAARPAYETLERALRADPARVELRRKLVPLAVGLRRYTDAQEHLVDHLLPASPDDPELLVLLGRCQEGTGKHAAAAQTFQKVTELAPSRLEAYLRLAEVLRGPLKKPQEADAAIERMASANATSCEAQVECGQYFRRTRQGADPVRLDRASAAAAAALAIAPDDLGALHLAAQCAVEKKDYDQARRHAARAVERNSRFAPAYLVLADVESRANRRPEAIAWLRRGIEANPKEGDLIWNLALLWLDDKNLDEAQNAVAKLRAVEYPEPLVAYLDARLEFGRERWLAASRAFERIRPSLTAWPDVLKQLDFWLGGCYAKLGNADQQLTAYRRAVAVDPLWVPARLGVAAALASTGRVDEALDEYRELMRLANAPAGGLLDLAQLEVLRNLRLNRAQRHWAEAERLLAMADRAMPDNPRVTILRAEIAVGKDQAAEGEKLLRDAKAKKPDEIAYRLTLAALAQRQSRWDEAAKELEETQRDLGDSVPWRLARAQYAVRRYGKESVPHLRALLANTGGFSASDQAQLWRGMAVAHLQAGDYAEARRLCRELARIEPTNLQVRLLLFDLALRAGDDTGLAETLEQIKEIEGEGAFWHYGTALHLSLQARPSAGEVKPSEAKGPEPLSTRQRELLQAAQKHLAEVRTLRPAWSRVPFLAAAICEREGEEEQAIEHYTRAVELGERSPLAIRRLVELLADRQRYPEADRVLRKLEEQQSPFSSELAQRASDISLRLDDFDRALELARQAARDSKRHQDHLWLANVLSILGQRARAEKRTADADRMWAEAEQELRRAVELSDHAPVAWVALVQFFARIGQKQRADEAIAEARKKIPAQHAPLALGMCYEAVGNHDEAEKKYLEAAAAAPSDASRVRVLAEFYLRRGKSAEAEAQLRKLVTSQVKTAKTDLVWARRALALLLSGRGNYESLRQGLDLIELNLKTPRPAIQDQRVKAMLLSSCPKREQRDEAIELLEQVVRDHRAPTTAEDRFVLARLYLAQGPEKWSQASRHFRALLGSAPTELPRYIAAYGAALLARKEIDEAELWVRRLEKAAPGQLPTVTLRALAQCERGRHDDAIAGLKSYLDAPASQGEDRATRIALVAGTLEELAGRLSKPEQQALGAKYVAEAEKLYRQYAEMRPDQKLVLAAFLARQKRMDEAVTLAEQAWPTSKPELIAPAMVSLLSGSTSTSPEQARAEKMLTEAIAKHNRPVPFLLILADYLSVHGRPDEAEAIYREILQKNPNHIAALNNLAMLLALRNKQLDEALQFVGRAIELTGPTVNSLDSRAAVYLARGEAELALEDIQAVLADSKVAMAYFRQAQILLALHRTDEAAQSLKTAHAKGLTIESLHPLERPAYQRLGKDLP